MLKIIKHLFEEVTYQWLNKSVKYQNQSKSIEKVNRVGIYDFNQSINHILLQIKII